jgi:hypothetical protein
MEQHSLLQSLLKDPWEAIDGQAGLSLNQELKREITEDHPLANKALNAVARSYACDDVLYHDKDSSNQYYLIHLTWAKESSSKYPTHLIFNNQEDFIKYCRETFQFTFQFNEDLE